jgi:hypothetical protein
VTQHLGEAQRLMDVVDAAAVRRELDAVLAIDLTHVAPPPCAGLERLEATRHFKIADAAADFCDHLQSRALEPEIGVATRPDSSVPCGRISR